MPGIREQAVLEVALKVEEAAKSLSTLESKFDDATRRMEAATQRVDFDETSLEAQELQREIRTLGQQFVREGVRMADSLEQVGGDAGDVRAKIARVGDEVEGLGRSSRTSAEGVERLRSAVLAASVAMAALVAGVVRFAKASADASLDADRLERSLSSIVGSAEAGRREFNFVRDEANRLGVDINLLADSWRSFSAATINTVGLERSRTLFQQVNEEAVRTGASGEQTRRVLVAFAQIASKGKVSAEELRGQLGEALPTALLAAARAIQEEGEAIDEARKRLNELLEQGKLGAEEFLPRLGEELAKITEAAGGMGDALDSAERRLQRFKNTVNQGLADIGSPALDALLDQLEELNISFRKGEAGARPFGISIGLIINAIGELSQLLVGGAQLALGNFVTSVTAGAKATLEAASAVAGAIPGFQGYSDALDTAAVALGVVNQKGRQLAEEGIANSASAVSDFRQDVLDANERLREMAEEMAAARLGLDDVGQGAKDAGDEVDGFGDSNEDAKDKVDGLSSSLDTATRRLRENAAATRESAAQLRRLQDESLRSAQQGLDQNTSDLESLRSRERELRDKPNNTPEELNELRDLQREIADATFARQEAQEALNTAIAGEVQFGSQNVQLQQQLQEILLSGSEVREAWREQVLAGNEAIQAGTERSLEGAAAMEALNRESETAGVLARDLIEPVNTQAESIAILTQNQEQAVQQSRLLADTNVQYTESGRAVLDSLIAQENALRNTTGLQAEGKAALLALLETQQQVGSDTTLSEGLARDGKAAETLSGQLGDSGSEAKKLAKEMAGVLKVVKDLLTEFPRMRAELQAAANQATKLADELERAERATE